MFWCYLCGRFWYQENHTIGGTTIVTRKTVYLKAGVLGRTRTGVAEPIDHSCPECEPDVRQD